MSGEGDSTSAHLDVKYLTVAAPPGSRTVSRDSLVTESTLFSTSSFVSGDPVAYTDGVSPLSGREAIFKKLVELSVTLHHDFETLYPDGFLHQGDVNQRRSSRCLLLRSPSLASMGDLRFCVQRGAEASRHYHQSSKQMAHSISADSLLVLLRKETSTWHRMIAMSNLVVAEVDTRQQKASPQASMLCVRQSFGQPVGAVEKRDIILRWLRSVKENASDNYRSMKVE